MSLSFSKKDILVVFVFALFLVGAGGFAYVRQTKVVTGRTPIELKHTRNKDEGDLEAVRAILEEQAGRGVNVANMLDMDTALSARNNGLIMYTWDGQGRLVSVNWSLERTKSPLKGTISLSGLPELKFFNCSGHALTAVDISKNLKLERVTCDKDVKIIEAHQD